MRIGFGFDVHQLVKNRDLIIGGEKIEYDKGLLGHSDADVLIHSIMDGILGALSEGDIGKHFPDTSDKYKGISSLILLKKVNDIMVEKGYRIINIDNTIAAERPKLSKYLDSMKKNIIKVLCIEEEQLNIKATTTERLGYVGEGKGIACYSVVLLDKIN